MNLQEILSQIFEDRGPILVIIVCVATLVQIAPIKINPWGALFGWIGRQLNKDVINKVSEVEARLEAVEVRLDEHIEESSESELRAMRTRILDFSSSILRGINYHREKFEFMMIECDHYEKYCEDNDIKNGVAEASIAEIRRTYQERLHSNSFLVEKGE